MKLSVTGANGLVGSRLCALLASKGHDVQGLSRGPLRGEARGWRYASVELTDSAAVANALEAYKPEIVINPASMTDVDGCEKDPHGAFAVNVTAAAALAETTKRLNAHLLHVSTDYVFDGEAGPYAEDAIPNPRGVYALTKHMGEQAVRALGGSWAIARTAVVYGWPAAGRANFGAWLVGALQGTQPVKLFTDQFVSPSLALNVAELLAELAERRLPGLWNTSGASVVNRVEFARALCKQFGFSEANITPSRLADLNLASPRPKKSGLKVDKAQRELKTQPLALDAALKRFHEEWRQHPQ
jgi:dTDP-4-dehydrorhamnose reductase